MYKCLTKQVSAQRADDSEKVGFEVWLQDKYLLREQMIEWILA